MTDENPSINTAAADDQLKKDDLHSSEKLEFDEQQHQEDLYRESLKGLAENVIDNKLSARLRDVALKDVSDQFQANFQTVKQDFKSILSQVRMEHDAVRRIDTPVQYSANAINRANLIWNCPDKARVFHRDFNVVGYKADELKTMFALLVFSVRFMNLRTWGAAHNLMCGTIFGVTGPSGAGKSTFVKTLENFIDCSDAKRQNRIEEISDCSDQYLAFAGGEDGKGLSDKLICWDEMHSPGATEYTIPMRIMWQTATKGYYIRKSSVAKDTAGKREAFSYQLLGPLHHIFTTTDPAVAFELQFRNRTVFLDLNNSAQDRFDIHQTKLDRKSASESVIKHQRLLFESWNYLELLPGFRRLDPDDPESFVDIDTAVLKGLIDRSDLGNLNDDDARRVDILIVLVAAHALLNQKHREQREDAEGRWILVAAAEDFNAVLPVFRQCVLSDRKPQGKAHQDAFDQLVPKLVAGSMSKQEIQHYVGKGERTTQNYLKEWKHANVIEEEHYRYTLGPAIKDLVATSDLGTADTVRKAAKQVFQIQVGFQPNELSKDTKALCKCALHDCAESETDDPVTVFGAQVPDCA